MTGSGTLAELSATGLNLTSLLNSEDEINVAKQTVDGSVLLDENSESRKQTTTQGDQRVSS